MLIAFKQDDDADDDVDGVPLNNGGDDDDDDVDGVPLDVPYSMPALTPAGSLSGAKRPHTTMSKWEQMDLDEEAEAAAKRSRTDNDDIF